MNLLNILKQTLTEEKLPEGKKGILLLDIDDTLLKADSSLLKIYRKLPSDKVEVPLTSAEYAKEHVTPETKKYYDYRDFRDPQKVYNSIVKGAPLLNNLKVVDAFYNGGYKLGILTARGCADAVKRAIKTFLKVRDTNGNLVKAPIDEIDIHCVNDDDHPYPGATDFEKKQNVLRDYANKYDYLYFIDDDPKNIKALKALKKSDPEIAKRLRAIDAKKNMQSPVNEEVLNERTKRRMVEDEIFNAINDKDFEKALLLHFDKVKNTAAYSGLKDARSALKHMINYGLIRNFLQYEKSGTILEGYVHELKKYGLEHLDELAKKVEFNGNADYVKPSWAKSTLRKKFMAKNLAALNSMIEKAKAEGYTFKDDPKEGSTAKDGDFVYIYGTIKKPVNEGQNFGLQNLLMEMAKKDMSPEVLKDINNGNYVKAMTDYFKVIKDGPSYAKFNGDLNAALNNFFAYGLNRTFGAEERAGRIPKGAVDAMKKAFIENKNEILKGAGGDPSARSTYVKPEKEEKTGNPNLAGISKIASRIDFYKDLAHKFDLYGERVNEKYIPGYLKEKFLKNLDYYDKKRLEKDYRVLGSERAENKLLSKKIKDYLNNLTGAFDDFMNEHKGLSDKQLLDELKKSADFSMKDFMALERHFRDLEITKDVEKAKGLSRSRDSMPDEVGNVKKEYFNLISDLDTALKNDDIINYFRKNWETVSSILSPDDLAYFRQAEEYWKKNKLNPDVDLPSDIKEVYNARFDENKEHNFSRKYDELKQDLNKARQAYNEARLAGNESEMTKLQAQIEKYGKSVMNVLLDRLIAIGILEKAFNNEGIALDPIKGAERYEAIKKKKIQNEFSTWSPKYNKYFTGVSVKEMYDEIANVLKRLSKEQMLEKHLQVPMTQNIPDKKYTDEEMRKLYKALKTGGPNKLYEVLATPEFSSYRSSRKDV